MPEKTATPTAGERERVMPPVRAHEVMRKYYEQKYKKFKEAFKDYE